MIDKISIENFQSHKKSELVLDKGVNVIVGNSDVGKTAIIRALRWLVWNRPSGDAMRSVWGGPTSVTVYLDKHYIGRVRDESGNYYWLDGTKFEAVKTDVPAEVGALLNLNNINLQRQFDRPFLLDNSPGEIAAHFNHVAHLDAIDIATRNVQSWLRQVEQQIAYDEQRHKELMQFIKQYDGLEEIDGRLVELEADERTRQALINNKAKLSTTIEAIQSANKELDNLKHLVQLNQPMQELIELMEDKAKLGQQVARLNTTINTAKSIDREFAKLNRLMQLDEQASELANLTEDKSKLNQQIVKLQRMVDLVKNNAADIESNSKDITELQRLFKTNFPEVCPLCGKPK